jgi:serine/threonine protein phosphatase PrpC
MDTKSRLDSADEITSFESVKFPPPFSSLVNVEMYALSDQGHVRTNNEDHYLVVRGGRAMETVLSNLTDNQPGYLFEETLYAMVIADGLGGEAGGEIASREAIYTLMDLVLRTPDWQVRWTAKEENTVMWRMTDRFRQINAALLEQAAANPDLAGMSTTMTAAVTFGNSLIVGHIGDSRAYLLHNGKLQRLTRDHTLAQRLIDEGIQAPNDQLVRGLRNVLMQALGSRESKCDPDVQLYPLGDGDQLLLCTDGLTDMVDDNLIESVLSRDGSAQSACQNLVDLALSNGGKDNVTVIVARYSFPKQ